MGDIPPIAGTYGGVSSSRVSQTSGAVRPAENSPTEDRVEISQVAQTLSTLEPAADIRLDKVLAIREAIQNGTYETPEKIAVTVDRLWEILQSEHGAGLG